MNARIILVCLLLISGLNSSILAEESVPALNESSEKSSTANFSIGIDDLPWNPFAVSFRWWKNERAGRELAIHRIYWDRSEGDNEYGSGVNERKFIDVSRIRFDILRRKPTNYIERFFLIYGIGIGARFKGEWYKTTTSYHEEKTKRIESELFGYIPFGVEHYFWDRYPYLSYSLQADFYISGLHKYQYHSVSRDGPFESEDSTSFGIKFGIDPTFYFRVYF